MSWCLSLSAVEEFKRRLKDKTIDPISLAKMPSAERREFLEKFVGAENALRVNALFESKLLLKNQKKAYIDWAKKVAGVSKETKRDMISRIERMDRVLDPGESKQFLQDLASARLKIGITREEAKTISDLSKETRRTKSLANEDGIFDNQDDRWAYGWARVKMENFVNELKVNAESLSFRETPIKKILQGIGELPGMAKSLVATLDNSFWGRQGIKTLLDIRTSGIWLKNFLKSWKNIANQMIGQDVMDAIKAEIYYRPNAINGKYDAGDYGLSVLSEEAYPSAFPEKIPILGRLFKASEVAFNGGALQMRADLADRLIKIAERNRINPLDRTQAQGMGSLVRSLTGRGDVGLTKEQAKKVNILLFSIQFMKSNIDTLTAHQFDPKATKFTKAEAAKNLLSMVATIAMVSTLAKLIDPESVDEDPRSQNFGKIKVFGHWVDITGGMASFVTLASRTLIPTYRNGQWGLWKKSSTGRWTNLTAGQYGQEDAYELLVNGLFTNKLSPIAGLVRDALRGEMYGGEKFEIKKALANLATPLSIQTYQQLKDDPNSDFLLGSMILEGLGLSTGTFRYKSDWGKSTSKELLQFKEKVGEKEFTRANEQFNQKYQEWFDETSKKDSYKTLSDEGKSKLIERAKEIIKKGIFREREFIYQKPIEERARTSGESAEISSLMPR